MLVLSGNRIFPSTMNGLWYAIPPSPVTTQHLDRPGLPRPMQADGYSVGSATYPCASRDPIGSSTHYAYALTFLLMLRRGARQTKSQGTADTVTIGVLRAVSGCR